jgi:hypothetical protein
MARLWSLYLILGLLAFQILRLLNGDPTARSLDAFTMAGMAAAYILYLNKKR